MYVAVVGRTCLNILQPQGSEVILEYESYLGMATAASPVQSVLCLPVFHLSLSFILETTAAHFTLLFLI